MHKKITLFIALFFISNINGMIKVNARYGITGEPCCEIVFPKQQYVHLATSDESTGLRNVIADEITAKNKLQRTTLIVKHGIGDQFPWDCVPDGAVIEATIIKKVDFRVTHPIDDRPFDYIEFESADRIKCSIVSYFCSDIQELSDEYCEKFCEFSRAVPRKMVERINFGKAKFDMNPYRPVLTAELMFFLRDTADYFAQFEGEHKSEALAFWLDRRGFTIRYGPDFVHDLRARLERKPDWPETLRKINRIRPPGEEEV